jgi:CMP-N,N'-diacetyllegionaminic acid synthase
LKILAIVPARGGSKRIPRKNIRLLGGRPLLAWTIAAAKKCPGIAEILVSTDDQRIAKVARSAGALVPWLRPPDLATDVSSSVDVCLHALDWFERAHGEVDGVLLLQPTSPFRRRATLIKGCELFATHGGNTTIGVSPAESHPLWCFQIGGGRLHPFSSRNSLNVRSQDLIAAYVVNGMFYLITPRRLRRQRSFYGGNMIPLISEDPIERLDIDTKWDWRIATAICPKRNGKR